MAQSKRSQKVEKIENNVVYFYSDNNASTKHTTESKKLLSIARRSRKTQPNQGHSKKSDNFYKQLLKDYSLNGKFDNTSDEKEWKQILKEMVSKEDEKVIKEWLRDNKHKFALSAEETKEMGIITDYSLQYSNFGEIRIEEVLYDNIYDATNGDIGAEVEAAKELSHNMLEYEEFLENLEKELAKYEKLQYSDKFLIYYQEIEIFKFDMYTDSKLDWDEINKQFIQIFEKHHLLKDIDLETSKHLSQMKVKYRYVREELKKHE